MDRPRDSKLEPRAVAEALAKAPDAAAIQRALLPVDPEKLSANDVGLLSRTLQARPGLPDVRLGYLSNFVKHRLLDEPGHLELRGRYVPTAKNKPAETLYDDQGFRLLERRDSGEKLYLRRRIEAREKPCGWIEVVQDVMALGFR